MIGWFSAAEVVVVHRWKIIVNETHSVDHLQCNCSWHGLFLGSTKHLASSQAKDGADSLASGHKGIKHRLANLLRLRLGRNDRRLEGSFNRSFLREEVLIQVEFRRSLDIQCAREWKPWVRGKCRCTRECNAGKNETETDLHNDGGLSLPLTSNFCVAKVENVFSLQLEELKKDGVLVLIPDTGIRNFKFENGHITRVLILRVQYCRSSTRYLLSGGVYPNSIVLRSRPRYKYDTIYQVLVPVQL